MDYQNYITEVQERKRGEHYSYASVFKSAADTNTETSSLFMKQKALYSQSMSNAEL